MFMNMKIGLYKGGILIDNIIIDSHIKLKNFTHGISHAHLDHFSSNIKKALATKITLNVLKERKKVNICKDENEKVFLHNAGHVPGSSMFLVKTNGKRVLYTGDFNPRESFLLRGAEPLKADILIVECTYGKEIYRFPKKDEIKSIVRDIIDEKIKKRNVVLYGYTFGKAQQIAKLLDELDIKYYVHPSIAKINRVLEGSFTFKNCVYSDFYKIMRREKEGRVFLAPYSFRKYARKMGIYQIGFSGWAMNKNFERIYGVDLGIPFSDHADFYDLLEFIEKCSPEVVFTVHGFKEYFSKVIFEELGIYSQPLPTINFKSWQ